MLLLENATIWVLLWVPVYAIWLCECPQCIPGAGVRAHSFSYLLLSILGITTYMWLLCLPWSISHFYMPTINSSSDQKWSSGPQWHSPPSAVQEMIYFRPRFHQPKTRVSISGWIRFFRWKSSPGWLGGSQAMLLGSFQKHLKPELMRDFYYQHPDHHWPLGVGLWGGNLDTCPCNSLGVYN